ncbi:IS110 family transposase [Deinococcus sp. 6GRE01]|uniref:IS110 family transposase n=1 Tax=Deinococcus sp. 6GRE01 TaxID=2745873 RepID=UPI001E547F68|nr:IS110 family transposase [Deinococcus sp. 6GRE01]MCD0159390.1 IS110 family transposase [Deinococcus sp. 6GRE01]
MLVLGIDVGKRELFACLQNGSSSPPGVLGRRGPVPNTAAGLEQLATWVEKQAKGEAVHVVIEATNVYWERPAHHFHRVGFQMSVVNPAQIKYFARSVLRRGKTDAMDAEIIARYGLVMQPTTWTPPTQVMIELKQLTRERETVLARRTQENNHLIALKDAEHASVVAISLSQERLELVQRQVDEVEAALRALVEQDVHLAHQLKLLLSVPGFALISAITVIAETEGFARLTTGKEISAAAGMAPAPQQSGARQGRGRISKTGNARLRRIAYLSALGASKSHSRLRTYYRGMRDTGKPAKVALIALGRKLLCIGLAVVRSGQPYDDGFVHPRGGAGPTRTQDLTPAL